MSRVWANRPCIETLSTAKPQTMEFSFLQPEGDSFEVRMYGTLGFGAEFVNQVCRGLGELGPHAPEAANLANGKIIGHSGRKLISVGSSLSLQGRLDGRVSIQTFPPSISIPCCSPHFLSVS